MHNAGRAAGREGPGDALFCLQPDPTLHRLDDRRPHHCIGETARPPNALVYIISPKDGHTVTSPFRVQFGLSGMGVAPAGVETPNTGHHHLLIDANESLDPNEPIPQGKKHLHFGAGQTEALIELPPGKHTLQLVLGDRSHHLFHPPLMSDVITVNVN
jgi:hypothetical protein